MEARFWTLLTSIRSSYWFVPATMALLSILLGIGAVWVDANLKLAWLDQISWYHAAKPSGSREVLSTVAGSMITVAGVVFSITIVALSYSSSQYGPRMLTNFMSDRGNKITLGTFIACFVYCLVVLRTIRGGDEGDFVPQLAVLLGLVLALCSIGVLIFFIHHVPQMIHVNQLVAGIGRQLIRNLDRRYPEYIGWPAQGAQEPDEAPPPGLDDPQAICGANYGYIQTIDEEALFGVADKADVVVRLRCRPGDFVSKGRVLAEVGPASRVTDEVCEGVRGAFIAGVKRTPAGDLHFLITELVEIAARALSPGVNDPVTAMTCMDWLGAALEQLPSRKMPDPIRSSDGSARVIGIPDDFGAFLDSSFGQLRGYAARDPLASVHFLKTLAQVSARCINDRQRRRVEMERTKLVRLAEFALDGPSLEAVRRAAGRRAASGLGATSNWRITRSASPRRRHLRAQFAHRRP